MSQLNGKTAIVTGSSRGIGAEVAKNLAADGASVVVNYRQKAPRAQKVVQGIIDAGGQAVAVGVDLTAEGGAQSLVDAAQENFGSVDVLVLNASGGMEADLGEDYALRLNRDAQVNMLSTAAAVMPEGSRVVFVTSHQAHFIDQTATLDAYEPVARSKRAGELALREQIPALDAQGISLVVISGDMIEGTVTATLRQPRLVAMAALMLGSLRALWPWQSDTGAVLAPGQNWPLVLLLTVGGAVGVLALVAVDRTMSGTRPEPVPEPELS